MSVRRVLLWLVLAAVLAGTAWSFIEWWRPVARPADPWAAVPTESAVIVELSGGREAWNAFTGASQVWSTFGNTAEATSLDSLIGRTLNALEENGVKSLPLVAWMPRGERTGWLAVIAGPRDHRAAPWPALLNALEKGADANGRTFNPGETFPSAKGEPIGPLHVHWTNGLLLIGSDVGMVEEGLLQLKTGKALVADSTFKAAHATLGIDAAAHIMLHPQRVARMLGKHLAPTSAELLQWPAGWAALDVRSKPDALLLSGLLSPSGDDRSLLELRDQGAGLNNALRVVPAEAVAFSVRHISNAEAWLTDANRRTDTARDQDLFRWVEGSALAAIVPRDSSYDVLAALQSSDPAAAERSLLGLCDSAGCDTSRHRGMLVVRFPLADPYGKLLGPPFDALEQPYWCLLGDKVVLSNTAATVHRAIDAWTDGTSLAEHPQHMELFGESGTPTALGWWCAPSAARAWAHGHLSAAGRTAWEEHANAISRFSALELSIAPGQHGFHHVGLRLQHGGAVAQDTSIVVASSGNGLWSMALRSPIARAPMLMNDHVTGARYVLVQDTDHRLHAIGSTGKLMWTRELDGPMLGDAVQVDRFKNGKLQLVLNTAGRVHMIDRNGKDVEGWPVEVKDKCSGPVAVFDYENNKDYRLLVPTEEGGLLNLMPDGKPVQGWAPARLATYADQTARHLRVKNNDFVFVADHSGTLLLLDRKGAVRHRPKSRIGHGARVLDVRLGMNIGNCSVVWADSIGAVHITLIDGATNTVAAGASTALACTMDPTTKTLLIARMVVDSLQVLNGTNSTSAVLPCAASSLLLSASSKWGTSIAACCPDRDECLLLTTDGKPLPGSPISAARNLVVGDINKDGKPEAIVGDGSGGVRAVPVTFEKP